MKRVGLYRKISFFILLFAVLFLGGCKDKGVWDPWTDEEIGEYGKPYISLIQEIGCNTPVEFIDAVLAQYSFFELDINGEPYIGIIPTALYNLFLRIQNSDPDVFDKLRITFALILSEDMVNYLFGAGQLPNFDVHADNIHYLRTNYYIEDPYLSQGYATVSALDAGLDTLKKDLSGPEIDVLNRFPLDTILPLPHENVIPRMFQVQIPANCTIIGIPIFLPTVLVLNNLDFGTFNESTVVGKLRKQLLIMWPGPPQVFIIFIIIPGLPGPPPHPGQFCFPEEEDLIPIPPGGNGDGDGGDLPGQDAGGDTQTLPLECETDPMAFCSQYAIDTSSFRYFVCAELSTCNVSSCTSL